MINVPLTVVASRAVGFAINGRMPMTASTMIMIRPALRRLQHMRHKLVMHAFSVYTYTTDHTCKDHVCSKSCMCSVSRMHNKFVAAGQI